jgi:hypothetical protein
VRPTGRVPRASERSVGYFKNNAITGPSRSRTV